MGFVFGVTFVVFVLGLSAAVFVTLLERFERKLSVMGLGIFMAFGFAGMMLATGTAFAAVGCLLTLS